MTKLKRTRTQELQLRTRQQFGHRALENKIEQPSCRVCRKKGTMREEAPNITQTPETTWDIPLAPQRLELQKNCNFAEDEQNDS